MGVGRRAAQGILGGGGLGAAPALLSGRRVAVKTSETVSFSPVLAYALT